MGKPIEEYPETLSTSPSGEPATAESEQASIPKPTVPAILSSLTVDEEGIDPNEQDRDKGIGGSDAAAIIGVSPWSTRLDVWMEKTHHPRYTRRGMTPAMRWGKMLEPLLAAEYARTNRVEVVESPGRIWHPNGVQNANVDRFVFDGGALAGIWEGKTASDSHEWDDGVPVFYLPQIQQYLAVTGTPWADVSVLLPGGDFRTYRLESDIGYQIELEERVVDFWHRYIETGVTPPEADGNPDILFPVHHEPESRLTVARGTQIDGVFREILDIRAKMKSLEADEAALIKRAKMVLRDFGGADGEGYTVHWRQGKPSTKVGWQAVADTLWNFMAVIRRVLPDWETGPAAEYLDPNVLKTITGLYSVDQPGTRPFLLRSTDKEDK